MQRLVCVLVVAAAVVLTVRFLRSGDAPDKPGAEPIEVARTDWPWWRGPSRNGVADPDQKPPLKWSATQNVRWKAEVPGRGHGSPCVVGNQVFLATADEEHQTQSVLCLDRKSGEQRWQTTVHRGNFETKNGNTKSSFASCTPACDGRCVFVAFLNGGAVHATALDREGKQLWQTKVTDYVLHQGYGPSPAVYGPLVIVSADNKGGGAVAGLNRETGKIVWKHERPRTPNYASPIILNADGRDQLFLIGCDLVTSLDPLSGKTLWETKGATTECVTSTVTDGKLMFSTGGYPRNHVAAIRADGSGDVVWEKNLRIYVPSMLEHKGHLYVVFDGGGAACWRTADGKELWRARIGKGFSSSPVLAGENIYATDETGRTFVFKATPEKFELLAQNQLGDEALSTPAICAGRIYMRVASQDKGRRQELLYCLGASPEK